MDLRQLQNEQEAWVKHNFPGREPYYPLLGIGEELGELELVENGDHIRYLGISLGKLNHSHLKRLQGIRGSSEKHIAEAKDSVADLVIFLTDYCTGQGFDLQQIVEDTWDKVKQRDWIKYPKNGVSE